MSKQLTLSQTIGRLSAEVGRLQKQRDRLREALKDCLTEKSALGYRNSEYAFRRLDAINEISCAALAETDDKP